jgi:hypothetical protein
LIRRPEESGTERDNSIPKCFAEAVEGDDCGFRRRNEPTQVVGPCSIPGGDELVNVRVELGARHLGFEPITTKQLEAACIRSASQEREVEPFFLRTPSTVIDGSPDRDPCRTNSARHPMRMTGRRNVSLKMTSGRERIGCPAGEVPAPI